MGRGFNAHAGKPLVHTLSLAAVAAHFGKPLPEGTGRGYCPVREHKRGDKTASLFRAPSGDLLLKCRSCDPPDDVMDAIALYAALAQVDRKAAWHQLRDLGFAVPGLREDGQTTTAPRPKLPPKVERPMPISGRSPDGVIALEMAEMDRLRDGTSSVVLDDFAAQRSLPRKLLDEQGLVTLPTSHGTAIGFVYTDPSTGQPCRIKCKHPVPPERGPAYFIMPAKLPGETGCALAPLYLGHLVQPAKPCIIVEGEIDALSVLAMGFENVVSLPDGADSAKHCNLLPLAYATPWLVCTDTDPPGDRAAAQLINRARTLAIDAVRVRWQRLSDDGGLTVVKDANEALQKGFTREDFIRCMQLPLIERYGFDPFFGG